MTDDQTFVLYLMAVLAATIAVMAICAAAVAAVAFNKAGETTARMLVEAVARTGGLQILAVIVIGLSAFVLRILELIGADAAMAALTGIAGYVLGGLASSKERSDVPIVHPPA